MLMYDALGVLNNKLEFGHNQLFNYIIWTTELDGCVLKTKNIVGEEPIKDREVEGRSVMLGFRDKADLNKPLSFRVGERPPIDLRLAFLKNAMEVLKYTAEWEQEGFSVFGVVITQRKEDVNNGQNW